MLRTKKMFAGKYVILTTCGLIVFFILLVSLLDKSENTYVYETTKVKLKSLYLEKYDYAHLLNLTFSFKMLPLVCDVKADMLLILVHSATDHFNNRKVIRETWGKADSDIRILFLIGLVDDPLIQEKLEEESSIYDDLLQGNFLDTYHNLTYKHVMGLKYVVYHCPNTQFILKADDDTFINVPTLKEFVKSYICRFGQPNEIFCLRIFDPPVLREGKWATSVQDYPEDNYPTHCLGFVILYPRNVVYALYSEAQSNKFFWVDDVFVSGICAKKSNISHIGIEDLVLPNEDLSDIVDKSYRNSTKPFLVGKINLEEKEIRCLSNFVINHTTKTLLDYLNK